MSWYLAGIAYEDGELRPGAAPGTDAGPVCLPAGMKCYAYNVQTNTVLAGLAVGSFAPDGWVVQSLADAEEVFSAFYGREPRPEEVS